MAEEPHVQDVERGEHARRVVGELVVVAANPHRLCAPQQGARVDPGEAQGQEARRREHTEAPADVAWNRQCGEVEGPRELSQRALFGVGDRDDVARERGGAELLLEPAAHAHELRGGLDGAAGLADHQRERALGVERVEERAEQPGIAVVGKMQTSPPAQRRAGERRGQRRHRSPRTQRGAPDAQHQDVVDALAVRADDALASVHLREVGRQAEEPEPARLGLGPQA
jgi:hypothetical protein